MHFEGMRIFNFGDLFLLIHLDPALIRTLAYLFLSLLVSSAVVLPDLVINPPE